MRVRWLDQGIDKSKKKKKSGYINDVILTTAPSAYSSLMAEDVAATIEKLKAQLLQKKSDLAAALQAFEEYKEVTK